MVIFHVSSRIQAAFLIQLSFANRSKQGDGKVLMRGQIAPQEHNHFKRKSSIKEGAVQGLHFLLRVVKVMVIIIIIAECDGAAPNS